MIVYGIEMAVVGGSYLQRMHRALGAVHVKDGRLNEVHLRNLSGAYPEAIRSAQSQIECWFCQTLA